MNYVMILAPDASTQVIACRDIDQCLEVVKIEGDQAVPGTSISLFSHRSGALIPVARWQVGLRGLRRAAAYRMGRTAQREQATLKATLVSAGGGR